MSEAPAASRSRPEATVQVPPSARTTPSWPASRVTDGVVVTKRSGQKRRSYRVTGRLVEPAPRASRATGRIRAKTNQVRIGDPATGTQIREQSESNFCADRRTGPHDRPSSSLRSFPAPAEKRTTVRLRAQSVSESVTCRIADRHRALSHAPDVVKHGRRNLASPRASLAQCGTWRRDRGQTGSESATRRFAQFGGRKATAIGRWLKPSQIMAPKGLRRRARLNPSSPP